MKGTIIVSVVLFVAVVAASIFYFTGLGSVQKDLAAPLASLPEETLFVAAFKNDETTDNIFKDYEVFDAILGFKQKARLDSLKQEVLRSPVLSEYLSGTDVYISFHQVEKEVETLFTIPTSESIDAKEIASILNQIEKPYNIAPLDTLGNTIYALTSDSSNLSLYIAYQNDIFSVSPSVSVLAKVLDKRHPKLSRDRINFYLEHTNRNVPLSIYFAHQQVDSLTKQFQRRRPRDFMQQFLGLGGQSAWNINYKQDALMLTGESELAKTENSYIALFAKQQKQTQRLYNYFPSNTALYLEYALSDERRFRQDLERYVSKKTSQKRVLDQIANLRSSRQSLMQNVEQSIGKEFALLELDNGNYLGFASLKDSTAFEKILNDVAESAGDNIYRFKYEHLMYAFYGDALQNFQRPYLTIVDDIIVMANQSSTLTDYLRRWRNSDLLIGTLGFKNYERLQGNEANVTFFAHTKNASRMLGNNLATTYARNFRNNKDFGYQDFYSWSVQLTGNGGNFISSMYGIYKSSNALGVSADWTYAFNNRLITRPYVFEHSDTSQFILAQEQDHTVHAIHPSGNKMWSAVFSGRIIGDMVQWKDRSIFLVTDRNRLYRFDTNGKGMDGFSLGLPEEPTGSPTIASFAGQDIILVPLSDRLEAYDMQGNIIDNWNMERVSGRLLSGIHFWKEFIVVGSTKGFVYFLGSDGKTIKRLDGGDEDAFRSELGRVSRADEEYFVATDTEGVLHWFSFDKENRTMQLPDLSAKHRSYFTHLSSPSNTDMVILDDNMMYVYELGDSVTTRFKQGFTKDLSTTPLFLPNGSVSQLGISIPSNNIIYVFGENGTPTSGFPIEALPLFYYGRINYNGANYLLSTKRDHKLYAYKH